MALTDKLTAIGDAIREKTGSADLIPLSDMPSEIDAVYRKGAQSEYDAFWDAFQIRNNELRTSYEAAFQSWRHPCFTPKYDIILAGPYNTQAFRQAQGFDLYDMIVGRGLTFDTSGATALTRTFNQSAVGKIPPLDLSSCTSLTSTFEAMGKMAGYTTTSIILNNVREDCTFNRTFYDALYFENITITGTIGQNGFDVSSCRLLNKASLTSIINALSDTATGKTVTLSEAAVIRELIYKQNVTIPAKPNDEGYYKADPPFDFVGNRYLFFFAPMDVRIWGGRLVEGEYDYDVVYEIIQELKGVNKAFVGDSSSYDGYYYVEIKRTDGKELSEADVVAVDYEYLGFEWDELVGSKPNWNIVLA